VKKNKRKKRRKRQENRKVKLRTDITGFIGEDTRELTQTATNCGLPLMTDLTM
jgi:hypothetical protein